MYVSIISLVIPLWNIVVMKKRYYHAYIAIQHNLVSYSIVCGQLTESSDNYQCFNFQSLPWQSIAMTWG